MSFKQRRPRTAATRQKDITEDDDADDLGSGISPMAAAQARKKREGKKKVVTAGAALSFAEQGDETPAFVPKKSTLSQSIHLAKLAHQNTSRDTAPPATAAGAGAGAAGAGAMSQPSTTYSTDYLAQLKAATPTRATLAREPDVVVPYDDDDSALALADTAPAIPDEAAIASAITRRRRLAADPDPPSHQGSTTGALGSDADYVSLNADTSRLAVYDAAAQPHPESRLQRESDSDGSGDEALAAFTGSKDRIRVGKNGNEEAARRMRREMRDAVEEGGAQGDEDEDEERWEVEQVRRAGVGIGEGEEPKREVRAYTSAKIPAVRPLPTPTSAANRLTTSLSYLAASQATTASQLAANERERARLEEQEADVRREVERVEAKREWMQGFVGWVELLGGFLEDKVPVLDKIEADGVHHWTQRKEMITRRRREDDADDVALFLGVPPAAADAQPETDELGRTRRDDLGPYANVRKYRRQARSTRRQARRRPDSQSDGYSTDASLASADAEDYSAAQQALRDRAAALDADVKAEEFIHPERGIGRRFAEWREREPEEYEQAFGGLGCVQGWEYWARKEMVGWEPSRSSRSVDSFEWFHALHAYSHPQRPRAADEMDTSDDDEEPPLAPEGDMAAAMVASLVSRLVERAVVAGEYDIYSLRQTRRLGDLVDLISGYTEKEGQKYKASLANYSWRSRADSPQALLKAVLGAFLDEAKALVTLVSSASQSTATPPPAFDPAARTALSTFTNRRLKLIKNMLIWRRYAPEEIRQLAGMVLGQVIRPCLTRCWDSGGKELADKVMHAVPESLMTVDVVAFFKAAK